MRDWRPARLATFILIGWATTPATTFTLDCASRRVERQPLMIVLIYRKIDINATNLQIKRMSWCFT